MILCINSIEWMNDQSFLQPSKCRLMNKKIGQLVNEKLHLYLALPLATSKCIQLCTCNKWDGKIPKAQTNSKQQHKWSTTEEKRENVIKCTEESCFHCSKSSATRTHYFLKLFYKEQNCFGFIYFLKSWIKTNMESRFETAKSSLTSIF